MRETGAICQTGVLARKRCSFAGSKRASFRAFGTIKIVNVLFRFFLLLWKMKSLRDTGQKKSQMLYLAAFGHQDLFDMINVKSRPTKPFWAQKNAPFPGKNAI